MISNRECTHIDIDIFRVKGKIILAQATSLCSIKGVTVYYFEFVQVTCNADPVDLIDEARQLQWGSHRSSNSLNMVLLAQQCVTRLSEWFLYLSAEVTSYFLLLMPI